MDEDMNVSYNFTDKLGHLVLTRQMQGSEPHDTYYVYDEKGNLCFVLQPMYQNSANLDLYAFQYKYDGRNRCIYKKFPGAQYIAYIYDNADRLIYSQDARQRSRKKLTFYEYDLLGRLIRQGECTDDRSSTSDHPGPNGEIPTSASMVYIQNYYDDYSFAGGSGFPTASFTKDTSGHGKGFLTGSSITVFGTDMKIYVAHYYDIKGRETKTVQSNLLGGYDVTVTTYTFTDKPATVTHTHTANGKSTWTEAYTYTYDHANRISKVQHTFGGTTITLYDALYDDFGRLMTKSLHGSATNKLTYTYNLRGWLTEITGARFTQNMYYNTGVGTAKYNGSISSMTWKAGNESTVRGYKFTYDGLDRLLNGTYGEGEQLNSNSGRYSENVTGYDKNGNITGLERYGRSGYSSYGMCDALTYTLNGNQMTRVDDLVSIGAGNDETDFKDAVKQANEYTYDANGNLTKDLNKGITGITYNCLNLPNAVTFSDGSTITYIYSADGTKLRAVHKIGSVTTTTDYCDNVIYENNTAKLLLTGEGYISLSDKKYHYYLQDHQGNNRVVVDKDGNVKETNHYYPFGGVFASTGSVQPYKYNGKELDTKKGLNWYDYGARMYDPALGRWHVVDPLAEKYCGVSPYTYCKNNPILRIDIDGKDDYVVNKNGYVFFWKNTKYEDKGDRVYYFDGEHKPKQVSGKPITIMDNKLMPRMVENQGKEGQTTTYGQTSNIHDAANLFKFAADNSVVEWKLDVYENENDGPTAIIITDHKEGSVESGNNAKRRTAVNGRKKIDIHSHPGDESQGASASDMKYINSRNNAVYLKRNRTLHDYNSKKSNITTIHINTVEDLQKYIQDRLKK